MKIALAALSLSLFAAALYPVIIGWTRAGAPERSFSIRFTIFAWLLAALAVLALVFLPNKGRVLMIIPIFLSSVALAKWWKNTRFRLRREAQLQTNFERARPIN
jgi:hypothetical protein